jgi:hypothetical protein
MYFNIINYVNNSYQAGTTNPLSTAMRHKAHHFKRNSRKCLSFVGRCKSCRSSVPVNRRE